MCQRLKLDSVSSAKEASHYEGGTPACECYVGVERWNPVKSDPMSKNSFWLAAQNLSSPFSDGLGRDNWVGNGSRTLQRRSSKRVAYRQWRVEAQFEEEGKGD